MDISSALVRRVLTLAACAVVSAGHAHDAADPHAHHQHAAAKTVRSTAEYVIPDVKLVRDDGKSVTLKQELGDGRPVVLNFIYTTCTSICPLSSQTFADLQASARRRARARCTWCRSRSIPRRTRQQRLREYAQKFGAGPEWQHYTGTLAASLTAQRAFNVDRGGKMNHAPVTLIRLAPGVALGPHRWLRNRRPVARRTARRRRITVSQTDRPCRSQSTLNLI